MLTLPSCISSNIFTSTILTQRQNMELTAEGSSRFLQSQEQSYSRDRDLGSCVQAVYDALEEAEMRLHESEEFLVGLVSSLLTNPSASPLTQAMRDMHQQGACSPANSGFAVTPTMYAQLDCIFKMLKAHSHASDRVRDDRAAIARRLQEGVGEWSMRWCTQEFYEMLLEPLLQPRSWRDLLSTILDDYDTVHPFDALRWWMTAVFCRVHARVEPSLGQLAAQAGLAPRKLASKDWRITRADVQWVTKGLKLDTLQSRTVNLYHCHNGRRTEQRPRKKFALDISTISGPGYEILNIIKAHPETSRLDGLSISVWPVRRCPDDDQLRTVVDSLDRLYNNDYLHQCSPFGIDSPPPLSSAHDSRDATQSLPTESDTEGSSSTTPQSDGRRGLSEQHETSNSDTTRRQINPHRHSARSSAHRRQSRPPQSRIRQSGPSDASGERNGEIASGLQQQESFAVASFRPCRSQVTGHEFLAASREFACRYVRGIYQLEHVQFSFCSEVCQMLQDRPPQIVARPGRLGDIARAVWALMQGHLDVSGTLINVGLTTTPKIMVDVLNIKAEMMQHARTVCGHLDLNSYVVLLELATAFCIQYAIAV